MARIPVISSPCPLRWKGAPQPGLDFCGHCQRRVYNLDLMSGAERETFLNGCSGSVCISYSVRGLARVPLVLGLGLAMLASATNADDVVTSADSPYCDPSLDEIFVGGTEAGQQLQWVDESEAKTPDKTTLPDIDAATWLPTPKS